MIPVWRKSSHSGSDVGGSDCVEVADLAGNIGVRDSKNAGAPDLVLTPADWSALVRRVKRGEHDLS
ncbi:DUF397 domain-containing protein [Spirillospora sp. CA-253888]